MRGCDGRHIKAVYIVLVKYSSSITKFVENRIVTLYFLRSQLIGGGFLASIKQEP